MYSSGSPVAEHQDPGTGKCKIVGVARLSKSRIANDAEFALLVADEYQRRGIGTELLRRLVHIGGDEKLSRITGEILRDNSGMIRAAGNVGFHFRNLEADGAAETNSPVQAFIVPGDE